MIFVPIGVRGAVAQTARMLVAGKSARGKRVGEQTWFELPPVNTFEAVELTMT